MVGYQQSLSFHVPFITSAPRNFNAPVISLCDLDGGSSVKPGGGGPGSGSGAHSNLCWTPNSKPPPKTEHQLAEEARRESKRLYFRDGSSYIPENC